VYAEYLTDLFRRQHVTLACHLDAPLSAHVHFGA
jgi:hypothetical protein